MSYFENFLKANQAYVELHGDLHLPKHELKICANSHTAGAYFIQKALLDGKEKQEISHQDLLEAQLLQFDLSWLPPHA